MTMEMQRRYEDISSLEEQLKEIECRIESTEDEELLIDLSIEKAELEERINFAWQDNEYLSEGGEW